MYNISDCVGPLALLMSPNNDQVRIIEHVMIHHYDSAFTIKEISTTLECDESLVRQVIERLVLFGCVKQDDTYKIDYNSVIVQALDTCMFEISKKRCCFLPPNHH